MAEKLSPWCKRAKIAMIKKDIAVNDLSAELEYNRSYISSVLNGRVISPPVRKRISDFLNISDSDDED
ncbi:MAG: helix-turn-helix transcriptional regulator [Eubacteriales bacterium]|nr:helix-turn-helix transcriptional regulator [Eubacteriales bacterium]